MTHMYTKSIIFGRHAFVSQAVKILSLWRCCLRMSTKTRKKKGARVWLSVMYLCRGGQKTVRHWQHLCSWAARQVPACKGSLQLVVRENLWIVNNTNYVSTRVAHLQMKGHCMVFHWVVLSQVPRLTWMVNTTSCEAKNGVLQTATTQKRQCPLVGLSATTNNQTFHNKKSWMKMDDINENE